ncbi:Sterol 3-beta-glucosyltransferase (Autophagy-related protein 26) [Durusdinium trenchii]|uniref:Sterol 3-beta-glucosyltransferase (Autophagy-related protein 26) n=1 Tax=Durusdinium trenchii TaxID=1381693 RepID=A0ABP0J8Q3_9DINO
MMKTEIPVLVLSLQHTRPSRSCSPMGLTGTPTVLRKCVWYLVMSIMLKSELKNSSKVIAQLTGKPAPKLQVLLRELYQVWSANPAFLSIIACSPTLNGDIPAEFNANNVQIGALMPTPQQQQGSEFGGEQEKLLEDFLAAGSAPVYFGYGSLICGSSKFMCLLSLRALKKTGERGILVSSWSTMSEADILGEPDAEELKAYCAEKVLFMKTAPHGRLFPRCKVCVHHGGAGTFNSSARSGTPTVITPIIVDQYDHSDLLNQMGFGVGLKMMSKLKPDDLAGAIQQCIHSESIKEKAKAVAQGMEKEDGQSRLVEVVNDYFESHIKTGRHAAIKAKLDQQRSGCCACMGSLCCKKPQQTETY